jgi:membrane protease YdiL (CAAX protease family)
VTTFQQTALLFIALWLVMVAVWFRRSIPVLLGGLVLTGVYVLACLAYGKLTAGELGLGAPDSWPATIGFAVGWLAVMLAYSPVADRLATRLVQKPPTLDTFRAIQESKAKLIAGIVVAWVLGGFLEELVFRGIVLKSVECLLAAWFIGTIAASIAVCVAAVGAGIVHLYQGPRAVVIVTQLSVLFGVLFVVSGHNLWAVMLCHGLYDTIAFIRFAAKKSKYSKLNGEGVVGSEGRHAMP